MLFSDYMTAEKLAISLVQDFRKALDNGYAVGQPKLIVEAISTLLYLFHKTERF
jgi:hypothetical protein